QIFINILILVLFKQQDPLSTELFPLPNEILTLILTNIRDIRELLLLRLVNSRWRAVIKSLCQVIHSLIIGKSGNNDSALKRLGLHPNAFAIIPLKYATTLSYDFCNLLRGRFPNLQHLV